VFIELVDLLRCTNEHEDSWLVAAIYEKLDRDIIEGRLGCPVCGAEYPIHEGIAVFGDGPKSPVSEMARGAYDESDDDAAIRCAALLDLFDPGGAVVLGGSWGRAARALLDITPVSVLLIAPPPGVTLGRGLSAIRVADRFPVAAGSLRGVALDDSMATPTLVESAARALKPGGRLVAPVAVALPAGIAERARDDRHWVGEAGVASSVPIPLARNTTRAR
jgi:uncharacterized protein YbaR (Trm112 family)